MDIFCNFLIHFVLQMGGSLWQSCWYHRSSDGCEWCADHHIGTARAQWELRLRCKQHGGCEEEECLRHCVR